MLRNKHIIVCLIKLKKLERTIKKAKKNDKAKLKIMLIKFNQKKYCWVIL